MIEGDRAEGVPLLEEVAAWGATADESLHVLWASFASLWLGDSAGFGALVERAGVLARQRGEVGILADALGIERCSWRSTVGSTTRRSQPAREPGWRGSSVPRISSCFPAQRSPSSRLREGTTRRRAGTAEEVLARATAHGMRLRASFAVYALALADLGRARWAGGPRETRVSARRWRWRRWIRWRPRRLPTGSRPLSRPDGTRPRKPRFPAWKPGQPTRARVSMQPRLAACRALLAEGDAATEHFEEALRARQRRTPARPCPYPALYGEHLRRERRRTDARLQLRAALEGFERLQAEPWAERARVELRASGETARKRDPSTISQLTPQELQVARYVADGLSNKAIATQLFLSPRTIDSHLRRVFAKLGNHVAHRARTAPPRQRGAGREGWRRQSRLGTRRTTRTNVSGSRRLPVPSSSACSSRGLGDECGDFADATQPAGSESPRQRTEATERTEPGA